MLTKSTLTHDSWRLPAVKDTVALASLPPTSQPRGGLHWSSSTSGRPPAPCEGAPGNDPPPHKPADDAALEDSHTQPPRHAASFTTCRNRVW